jgi:aryl-alcohol dehydrogenase-like predicted oxidoreductase
MPSLALGTMNFGKRVGAAEATRLVARALEVGVKVFDTANAYGDGEAERILGRALKQAGSGDHIVATKVGLLRVGGRPEGLSPAVITAAVEQSLSRLGVDVIDIYYLHAPDRHTPIELTLDGLQTLIAAGKIRRFGVSNYAAWQILEIIHLTEARGMARPAISQVLYNLLIRDIEVEYLPFCQRYPVHTTVYNPLAGGLLVGALHPGEEVPAGSRFAANPVYRRRYLTAAMFERVSGLKTIADEAGVSLLVLAYAWLAARPGVDSILVGPGSSAHLDAAVAAVTTQLSDDCLKQIDALHLRERGSDTFYAR